MDDKIYMCKSTQPFYVDMNLIDMFIGCYQQRTHRCIYNLTCYHNRYIHVYLVKSVRYLHVLTLCFLQLVSIFTLTSKLPYLGFPFVYVVFFKPLHPLNIKEILKHDNRFKILIGIYT